MFDWTSSLYTWLTGWGKETYSCSAESHTFAYTLLIMSVIFSTGGVYVWRRFIRTQPSATIVTK